MKVAVDTNVLVRAVVRDDPAQADVAAAVLTDAELIAVALPCLCEFVWVLLRVYGFQQADAASAIRALLAAANVEVNRPAVEAGLLVLDAGGDFADGVIAYEATGLAGKPSFPSIRRRWHFSRRKGNQRAFCDGHEHERIPPTGREDRPTHAAACRPGCQRGPCHHQSHDGVRA